MMTKGILAIALVTVLASAGLADAATASTVINAAGIVSGGSATLNSRCRFFDLASDATAIVSNGSWSLVVVTPTACGTLVDKCTGTQSGTTVTGTCANGGAFGLSNLAYSPTGAASFYLYVRGTFGPTSYGYAGQYTGASVTPPTVGAPHLPVKVLIEEHLLP